MRKWKPAREAVQRNYFGARLYPVLTSFEANHAKKQYNFQILPHCSYSPDQTHRFFVGFFLSFLHLKSATTLLQKIQRLKLGYFGHISSTEAHSVGKSSTNQILWRLSNVSNSRNAFFRHLKILYCYYTSKYLLYFVFKFCVTEF